MLYPFCWSSLSVSQKFVRFCAHNNVFMVKFEYIYQWETDKVKFWFVKMKIFRYLFIPWLQKQSPKLIELWPFEDSSLMTEKFIFDDSTYFLKNTQKCTLLSITKLSSKGHKYITFVDLFCNRLDEKTSKTFKLFIL